VPYPYSQPHNIFLDNLADVAPNIAYWLAQAGGGVGSLAAGQQTRLAAASAGINTTETIIVQLPLIPGTNTLGIPGTLRVGSRFVAVLNGLETNTVANTSTFTIRAGILGTIADQSLGTFVTAVSGSTGTAVPFTVTLDFTVTALGATGTASGMATVVSTTAGIIGAALTANGVLTLTNFNTLTSTFIEVTALTAATTTTNTFQAGSSLTLVP
jgi:hypothetical protein